MDKNINISSFLKCNFRNLRHNFSADEKKENAAKIIPQFFLKWGWSFGKKPWLGTIKTTAKVNKSYNFLGIWSVIYPIQSAVF